MEGGAIHRFGQTHPPAHFSLRSGFHLSQVGSPQTQASQDLQEVKEQWDAGIQLTPQLHEDLG